MDSVLIFCLKIKNSNKIITLPLFIASIGIIGHAVYINILLNKEPLFVLAKVKKREWHTEGGTTIYYSYWYNGKLYEHSISEIGCGNGTFLLIQIVKKSPDISKLYDCYVPSCLANDEHLNIVWTKLPDCH